MFEEIAKNLDVKRKYISCPYAIAYFGAWVNLVKKIIEKMFRDLLNQEFIPTRKFQKYCWGSETIS